MKRRIEVASLKWYDFVLQEQLKSFMCVVTSLHGYPKKDRLINELNKKFICWYYIQKGDFIIHAEYFYANNIFSHPFIQNLKHKPNIVQDPFKKKHLKTEI